MTAAEIVCDPTFMQRVERVPLVLDVDSDARNAPQSSKLHCCVYGGLPSGWQAANVTAAPAIGPGTLRQSPFTYVALTDDSSCRVRSVRYTNTCCALGGERAAARLQHHGRAGAGAAAPASRHSAAEVAVAG